MPRAKTKYPEINDIKKDAKSLKKNITSLKDHAVDDLKTTGSEHYGDIKETISERIEMINENGQAQLDKVEGYVKEKPLQSIGIAFAAGIALSALMGRR